ncbi:MAG: methyltransferase domain-containing protein [Coriobacteriaceae bacterium]|nr:methyltransferase domain-containing protein [Coriobacteriaceae bacterium]
MDNVAEYFDRKAQTWCEMERNTTSPVQPAVALMAGVGQGARVLDVGSGLGVMVPIYLQLGAGSILCVDVSEEMTARASERWAERPQVKCLAADASALDMPGQFDAVVVYNAYPHIMDREAFVRNMHSLLADGGRFVVAHGAGKDVINSHHDAVAAGVSLGLKEASEEAQAWEGLFDIDAVVDTPAFFSFAGSKK